MENHKSRRIGLMGGTFDPIHLGHLILAESAYEQLELDQVLFLPAGNPPHKQQREGASDEARLAMVRLAIAGNPHFSLDSEEMYRHGYTYTDDTLASLTVRHPDTEYFFLVGADSLMTFPTWHNPAGICQKCTLAVAVRDQFDEAKLKKQMQQMKEQYEAKIVLLQMPELPIASSTLRTLRENGRSIRYYVPDAVWQYIDACQLYC